MAAERVGRKRHDRPIDLALSDVALTRYEQGRGRCCYRVLARLAIFMRWVSLNGRPHEKPEVWRDSWG